MGSLEDDDDRSKPSILARYLLKHTYTIGMGCCFVAVMMIVSMRMSMPVSSNQASSITGTGTGTGTAAPEAVIISSTQELQQRLADLRGDDVRLMRWNAVRYTRSRQYASCQEGLPNALSVILAAALKTTKEEQEEQLKKKGLACEYATFCVTDNPEQRTRLSDYANESSDSDSDSDYNLSIHTSIVNLVASDQLYTSAMASHLIYSATFSNRANHQGFAKAGAVSKLTAAVLKSPSSRHHLMTPNDSNLSTMWAAAALQNLAASYCDTEGDGRCYWKWKKGPNRKAGLKLALQSKETTILSDGELARQEMVNNTNLIYRLIDLTCAIGPVQGKMSNANPYVGANAVAGNRDHEASPNIMAWAGAGALKNMAISAPFRTSILAAAPAAVYPISREGIMHCLCRLAHSPDWLEKNKGQGALRYLRPTDPCWFQDDNTRTGNLCVDDAFFDKEGYTCSDYGHATAEECQATDSRDVAAKKACCACGGGDPEEFWSMTTTK